MALAVVIATGTVGWLLYRYAPYYTAFYLVPREWLVKTAYSGGRFEGLAHRVLRAQRMKLISVEGDQCDAIGADLYGATQHDWAGDYYIPDAIHQFGRTHLQSGGGRLLLAANGRYAWFEAECITCSRVSDWGAANVADDRIVLVSEFPYPLIGARRTMELIRVRWNGRHFLLPADCMDELGQAALRVEGRPQYAERLICREADREVTLTGLPDSPPELRAALQAMPIAAADGMPRRE